MDPGDILRYNSGLVKRSQQKAQEGLEGKRPTSKHRAT